MSPIEQRDLMVGAVAIADASLSAAFRERIDARANREAHLYLSGFANGHRAARELKEVIESIVATDYDGRTVVELLQNGHDAHPPGGKAGALEIVLADDEGAHG